MAGYSQGGLTPFMYAPQVLDPHSLAALGPTGNQSQAGHAQAQAQAQAASAMRRVSAPASTSAAHAAAIVSKGMEPRVPQFVATLYDMVDDPATDDIIVWTTTEKSGKAAAAAAAAAGGGGGGGGGDPPNAFEVIDYERFLAELMPRLSTSTSFCTFVRQLNGYGFSKADPKRVAFFHEQFVKGRPELLININRRSSIKRRAGTAQMAHHEEHMLPAPEQPSAKRQITEMSMASSSVPTPMAPPSVGASPAHHLVTPMSSIAPMVSTPMQCAPSSGPNLASNLPIEEIHRMCPSSAKKAMVKCDPFLRMFLCDALSTMKLIMLAVEAEDALQAQLSAMGIPGSFTAGKAGLSSRVRDAMGAFLQRQLPGYRAQDFSKVMDNLIGVVQFYAGEQPPPVAEGSPDSEPGSTDSYVTADGSVNEEGLSHDVSRLVVHDALPPVDELDWEGIIEDIAP